MSIEVTSGTVSGADQIKSGVNRAILRGIERGMLSAVDEFEPTIAKKTGLLRETFETAVRTEVRDALSATGNVRTISWQDIKSVAESLLDYAQYHFKARGFYVEPTTPNTFPMRLSRFKPIAIRNVTFEIRKSLRNLGIDAKEAFNIS